MSKRERCGDDDARVGNGAPVGNNGPIHSVKKPRTEVGAAASPTVAEAAEAAVTVVPERALSFERAPELRAPEPPSPSSSLPDDVLALILGRLSLSELLVCARVARTWHAAISTDARCWRAAMPQLDPLFLAQQQGVSSLFHRLGGSWLKVAAVMAARGPGGSACCTVCGRMDSSFVLCACALQHRGPSSTRTRAGAKAAALGPQPRCAQHCGRSPDCVALQNKWTFAPAPGPAAGTIIRGNGSPASGARLRAALTAAAPYSTIYLSGTFHMQGSLYLYVPVRIVGVKNATHTTTVALVRGACVVLDFAIIERMNLITTGPFPFDADGGYDLAKFCPALEVAERARIILTETAVTSRVGTAVLVNRHGRAFLSECSLHSYHNYGDPLCLGVLAKGCSTLSMYGCKVSRCMWGAFAGATSAGLLCDNRFTNNTHDTAGAAQYADMHGQTVQPWVAWRGLPEAASHSAAAAAT